MIVTAYNSAKQTDYLCLLRESQLIFASQPTAWVGCPFPRRLAFCAFKGVDSIKRLLYIHKDTTIGFGIYSMHPLKLIVEGDCTVTAGVGEGISVGIMVAAELTVSGTGTLTVADGVKLTAGKTNSHIVNNGTILLEGTGTIINNGTLTLPGTFTYATIPTAITGGNVIIGEATYVWNGEQYVCVTHTDADSSGRCDFCGMLMQPAKLVMTSVSLKGNIGINYYMLLSNEVLADSTAYMQFILADGEVIKIPVSEGVKMVHDGETYYVYTCDVDAKEMTDDIISQFFYDGGVSREHTYNVQTYARHILENYDDEATKNLITSMLNYGSASQIHFGYNTDNLANSELEIPDYSGVTISGFNAASGQGTELAKFYSASLILKSETTLRFFFQVDSSTAFTATYNGQALEVRQRSGLYYIDVVGIAAKDLDENVTVTINDGTNTAEVSFNPMSYCQGVQNDTTGAFDQEMKDLVAALYLYNQAANTYFKEN